jgi:hypothetical protein
MFLTVLEQKFRFLWATLNFEFVTPPKCKTFSNRIVIIAALLASIVHANARCNPVEARQTYICSAFVNCGHLKIDPSKIDNYSDAELLQKFDDDLEATVKSPPPGKIFFPVMVAYETELGNKAVLAARHVIVDIQSALISDYQRQASITFNEPALNDVLSWIVYEVLLKSNQSILITALASKEPQKAVQYMKTMMAVLERKAMQCIVHAPVYTPGLQISPD